ncbi:hypothetical protein GCM10009765_27450 [Fodinicola feengrottensis]|uniref:Uncharacterized protein n=1 Tax=Fodinicola feengrottensis TaxID=435914 RepID=A0ABP4SSG0_9ACTN
MTVDFVALCRSMPDVESTLTALLAAGPELRLSSYQDGAIFEIRDEAGRPLVAVEGPLLIQVPGELSRLLGPEVEPVGVPVWWVEARAASAREGAADIARRVTNTLAGRLNGVVWPLEEESS